MRREGCTGGDLIDESVGVGGALDYRRSNDKERCELSQDLTHISPC